QSPDPTVSAPSANSHLSAVLVERRDSELQKQHKRSVLEDRVSSLWTPVVVFLACFAPYVFLIEMCPPSATVAQPILQAIGLLLVGWYFAALIYRLGRPQFGKLRKVRVS